MQATRRELAELRSTLADQEEEIAAKEQELEKLRASTPRVAPRPMRGMAASGAGLPPRKRARTGQQPRPRGDSDGGDEVLVHEAFLSRKQKGNRSQFVKQVSRWVGADYEVCWDFVKKGVCRRGSRCHWRHPPSNKPDWTKVAVKEEPGDNC